MAKKLGLAKEGDKAFLQCLDPCRYTGGETVVFEISKNCRDLLIQDRGGKRYV